MWPFIIHKRGILPKCKLEELKESYMEKNRALNGNGESSNQEDSLTLLLTLKDCCEDGNHEGGLTPLRTTEGNGENGNEEGYLTPQSTMKDDEDLQDRLPENVMIVESNDDGNSEQHTSPSANAGENIDQGCQLSSLNSTSADGFQQDIDHDMTEGFNITLKENLLLSLQCLSRQDAIGKTGMTEQNLCVKCNQNGQLLACSSSDCPIVIHEGCLDFGESFDDKGHFYCPPCAYSLFISEYLEAKDKCSLAGKQLAEFIEVFPKNLEKPSKLKSHSRLNVNEELVGIQESGYLEKIEQNFISQNTEVKHGPLREAVDPRISDPPEEPVLNMHESFDNNHPTTRNTETVPVEGDTAKAAVDPQITDPRQEPSYIFNLHESFDNNPTSGNQVEGVGDTVKESVCTLNSVGFEYITNADDELIASSDTRKSRKRKALDSSPPVLQSRRMKLRWTKEEEEMLREGVPMFKGKGTNIPWRKILHSGSRVFQKRTPADLKDKWKRMCSKDKSGDVASTIQ